jgi:hypothetical protein
MSKTSTWSWAMTRNGRAGTERGRGECNSVKVGCYGSVMGRSYKKGLKVMILEGERNAIKNVTN